MARLLQVLLLAISLVLVASCGGSDTSNGGETMSVRTALAGWREADTGHFEQVTRFSESTDGPRQVQTGDYALSKRQASITAEFHGFEQGALTTRVVTTGGVAYLNMPQWPAAIRPCWLSLDTRALAAAQGLLADPGSDPFPGNLTALISARVSQEDSGEVDLAAAASMFGSGVVKLLGDELSADATVRAEFALAEDGQLASWRVAGTDLAQALSEEGVEVSSDLLEVLESAQSEVTYSAQGDAVTIEAPPKGLRMTPAQMDSQSCG